jgi:hypothetical protein
MSDGEFIEKLDELIEKLCLELHMCRVKFEVLRDAIDKPFETPPDHQFYDAILCDIRATLELADALDHRKQR